ncbi:MAG: Asp-tRNA(Asn)/Glu-tRNA(Gln) amidotransferase subunit GatA, partial [Oscillospiraceae bacterium]|nr:Asp-tRNA(Asn)/Glu-tRNA(Gln) amidotransferase subunit GatA [Oscillospiraceae bacterium]
MGKIRRIQELLSTKKVGCRELTGRYLDMVRHKKFEVNAYISTTEEEALSAADRVDKKIQLGEKLAALEGVPFALKDNISTAGLETSCASEMLAGYKPVYDAFVW